MAKQVIMGARLKCSFGSAPSTLVVLKENNVMEESRFAATINDHKPMVNIMSFGLCRSLANPTVAAATAAKAGTLTPMPCIPATMTPWTPGSPTVQLGPYPSLNDTSSCLCNWTGVITVTDPGQTREEIP